MITKLNNNERKIKTMENIIYKDWNISNAYNDKGVEYWMIWTPDMLDCVAQDFKTIRDAKVWIDNQEAI